MVRREKLTQLETHVWRMVNTRCGHLLSLFIESLLSCLDGYKPIYHNIDETDISLFIWLIWGKVLLRISNFCSQYSYTFYPTMYSTNIFTMYFKIIDNYHIVISSPVSVSFSAISSSIPQYNSWYKIILLQELLFWRYQFYAAI